MKTHCKCGRIKDNRAYLCKKCYTSSGNGRRGTGKYNPIYSNGYKLIHLTEHPRSNKDGYVNEHVIIMEDKMNRFLEDGEVIHHINGLRDDNRIENLLLTNPSEHCGIHNKLRAVQS